MDREEAIEMLMVYTACTQTEYCKFCPHNGKCSGWTDEEVLLALKYLSALISD